MKTEDRFTLVDNHGEYEIRVSPPASHGVRWSIVQVSQSNEIYGMCAALGVSWRGPGKPKTNPAQFKHDYARFGQAVFDELFARGCGPERFVDAASAAFIKCLDGLVNAEDVKALTDFIEAQEGSTG